MSVVTTIMMLPRWDEPTENINAFNQALARADTERGQQLRNIADVRPYPEPAPSDFWGGTKVPEADVWAAALNYFPGDQVVEVAKECRWLRPVLFIWVNDFAEGWQQVTINP
jgi:hypothetical protein